MMQVLKSPNKSTKTSKTSTFSSASPQGPPSPSTRRNAAELCVGEKTKKTCTARTPRPRGTGMSTVFRQLFRHLFRHLRLTRITVNQTWLDRVCVSRKLEETHQLFSRLRHRSIESLHEGADVGKLLHGVPQNPPLRPRLEQCRRPLPRHRHALVVGHRAVLRRGGSCRCGAEYVSRSSALVLVADACPRGAPCELCSTVARTTRSVSCSWRQCMRSRRSRRRFTVFVLSRSAMGPAARVRPKKITPKVQRKPV